MDNSTALTCERCRRPGMNGTLYQMQLDGVDLLCCIRCIFKNRAVMFRSVKIGLVVGTILFAFNQGDIALRGQFPAALIWKIPLTYITPFLVSLWGALSSAKR